MSRVFPEGQFPLWQLPSRSPVWETRVAPQRDISATTTSRRERTMGRQCQVVQRTDRRCIGQTLAKKRRSLKRSYATRTGRRFLVRVFQVAQTHT